MDKNIIFVAIYSVKLTVKLLQRAQIVTTYDKLKLLYINWNTEYLYWLAKQNKKQGRCKQIWVDMQSFQR